MARLRRAVGAALGLALDAVEVALALAVAFAVVVLGDLAAHPRGEQTGTFAVGFLLLWLVGAVGIVGSVAGRRLVAALQGCVSGQRLAAEAAVAVGAFAVAPPVGTDSGFGLVLAGSYVLAVGVLVHHAARLARAARRATTI